MAGLLIAGTLFAPNQVEHLYGETKLKVNSAVDTVRFNFFQQLPTVRLGDQGGKTELDRCDGTFTEMLSYQREGVPAVWAAHNNCGGDAILAWHVGQRIQVDGLEGTFEVIDIREVSKTWASTDDLVGLQGDFALQTCLYGANYMMFVGVSPIAADSSS